MLLNIITDILLSRISIR